LIRTFRPSSDNLNQIRLSARDGTACVESLDVWAIGLFEGEQIG